MLSPLPINAKEQKDLEVYIKQFCYKSIQTIVSSRHGSALSTQTCPNLPSWFNVTLADNASIVDDCKNSFSLDELLDNKTIALTIQLHNNQDEVMTLEIWTFTFEKRYTRVKITFTVYNALCLLLRSVITASRATPTYRLTRKQTTGGFFYD